MTTLRARLIALILGAILIVFGLATWVSFLLLEPPSFSQIADSNAAQIGFVLGLTDHARLDEGNSVAAASPVAVGFRRVPAKGTVIPGFNDDLREALKRYNLPADVMVTHQKGAPWPVASLNVPGSGWLIAPIAFPPPPPDISPALIGWILLITVGATGVAIMTVYKLTRPLALIEKTVANVGPHGEFPILPETGSAEVRATARAINNLSSRLKNAMESRMRLVAAAGHDLRTPMTRMRLRAEFLEGPDREKWLIDLDELDRIADSAIRLVREETTEETGETVRLDRLLEDVVRELQEQNLDIQLGCHESAQVLAGPLALKRAFRNLLINAATHGGGGRVTLCVRGDAAIVEISDHGPGIPDEMLNRALEPFFKVDPARTKKGGAGLGLAIANEIIQRNGGALTLSNGAPNGLVQTVELPLGAPCN